MGIVDRDRTEVRQNYKDLWIMMVFVLLAIFGYVGYAAYLAYYLHP